MSCQLLELVVDQAGLDFDTQQLQHVCDMVDSHGSSRRQPLQEGQEWRLQVGWGRR